MNHSGSDFRALLDLLLPIHGADESLCLLQRDPAEAVSLMLNYLTARTR